MFHRLLFFLSICSIATFFRTISAQQFPRLSANTSVLPPGWSGTPQCLAISLFSQLLFGPNFTDPTHLTIESCVQFCNAQGTRLAGLKGTECRCGNLYNAFESFESDPGECTIPGFGVACPGNPAEACGLAEGTPPLVNVFMNPASQFQCSDPIWPGGAPLTPSGSWRFSYFYNDSVSTTALPNRVLHSPGLPQVNLTVHACVTACESAGKFAYTLLLTPTPATTVCGNALQSNTHPITNCSLLPVPNFTGGATQGALIPCTGDSNEFCGGTNVISIFTLPGTGLVPVVPFDSALDDFCTENCVGHT
ncbi:hypothetical protein CPB84DRAFT_1787584 [Gymnopilus junonius]|uniref:WSC domain-containing protein n=1 Tax=Gymnopilus junonius TaxID=109634 RepID=A0A9P5NJ32_GYMJU|nr:hypothetical protein CPB84DRAFT_1787584 [Gymnopilus junonius]